MRDLSGSYLPSAAGPLFGRVADLAYLDQQLVRTEVRLLTLCGVGGIGKTRLALEVARRVEANFGDGVRFVELAPFREPALVISAIHAAVEPGEPPGSREPMDALRRCLQRRELLLVLDNFEQVLKGATVVADILSACPGVTVLATSRAPLHLTWEYEFAVGPLEVPSTDLDGDTEALLACPSVALLLERVGRLGLALNLSPDNVAALAAVCRRLDGIPLAIELAAARARMLSPLALLSRLERPLDLLTGGQRDQPARHRGLRQTFEWSYDLLADSEKRLFRSLGVFAGGCAVEQVAEVHGGTDRIQIIDALERLVDSGLVARVDHVDGLDSRLSLLEPVREYALELLEQSGEEELVRSRHAAAYLALAERAEPEVQGLDQRLWQARLDRDHANALMALRWYVSRGDVECSLRLASVLCMYWWIRGYVREGLERIEAVLAMEIDQHTRPVLSARARALAYAGALKFWHGQIDAAQAYLNSALELYADANEPRRRGFALVSLGNCMLARSDFVRARALYAESHAEYTAGHDPYGTARTRMNLGLVAIYQQDYRLALECLTESLPRLRKLGDFSALGFGLRYLAMTHCHLGDFEAAQSVVRESLLLWRDAGHRVLLPFLLETGAMVAAATGRANRAVTLAAAAEAVRDQLEARAPGSWATELEYWLAPPRAELGPAGVDRARAAGMKLQADDAVRLAIDDASDRLVQGSAAGLTRRETEVLRLLAAGNTNKEMSVALQLSVSTVERHVANIYAKIGARGRADATAFAITHGIATPG